MTSNVRVISPDQTIGEAAALMFKENIGALPVWEQDHLVGMITDRDIAIRGVGQGKGPDTTVREVMSKENQVLFRGRGPRSRLEEHG
jgi:CBS domain-containing protein